MTGGGESLIRELVAVHRARRSGVLEIIADSVRTFVYIDAGTPVFAEQGTLGDTLGRILLQEGTLTKTQYAQVIDRMTAGLIDNEQMRFGEVAVALGFLSPQQVHQALASQVQRKVVACLQWTEAEVRFHPAPEALEEVAHFPVEPPPLVLEGIRLFFEPARCAAVLEPALYRPLRLARPAAELTSELGLKPSEMRLLRTLDGTRTLDEVRRGSPLDPEPTDRILTALVLLDLLEVPHADGVEAPAPQPEQPPAGAAQVTAPPAGPEPQPSGADEVRRARARRMAEQLARGARGAQRVPKARGARWSVLPPASEQEARMRGESHFQKARHHAEYGAWPAALRELNAACALQPDVPEYALHALWATYRCSSDEAEQDELRAELDRRSKALLKRDRRFAFGYYVRGQLALARGEDEAAFKAFTAAAKLDPQELDAQRHRRLLARRLRKK